MPPRRLWSSPKRSGCADDWQNRRYYMLPGNTMKNRWEESKLDDLLGGASRMEFTLRFTLTNPDLDTTIVGTKSVQHLQDNSAAAKKGALPPGIFEEATRRLAEAGSMPAP